MFQGDHLQDEMDRKLQGKIAHKRRLEAERLERIRNGMRGINVATLDAQMKEKSDFKNDQKEIEKMMTEQAIQVEKRLAEQEEEESAIKAYAKEELLKSWADAKKEKQQRDQDAKNDPDYRLDIAGASSAINFEGADVNFNAKDKKKKEQMKAWIEEQIAEKSKHSSDNAEETVKYLQMLATIDEIRADAEKEEKQLNNYINQTVRDENSYLANLAKERKMKEKEEEMKNGFGYNQLLQEDRAYAFDSHGKLIRKDMFKGFTREQKMTFLRENQNLIDAKLSKENDNAEADYNWMITQMHQLKMMETADYQEKQMKKELNEENMRHLEEQRNLNKHRRQKEKEYYSAGNDTNDFFNKFGTSAR